MEGSYGKIEIVRWNDNSVVTLGSNAYIVEPVGTIKRWVKDIGESNANQTIPIDLLGLLDHGLFDLRSVIQDKKWYWTLVIIES